MISETSKKENKVRLCVTKYSAYANNYDDCTKQEIEGCDDCVWYVDKTILYMFEHFERHGWKCFDAQLADL